jgi:predicted short-subunit dehydrogenase-like oxidoreductase (DUF2520 family)
MITVGIAGTGQIARAMGYLLRRSGLPIHAVAGRSPASTADAARFMGAENAVSIEELPGYARHLLIAVSDDAIPQVASGLAVGGLRDAIVLHTSGAAGPQALATLLAAGNSIGVLHPLQTVPSAERGIEALSGATYAFAGDDRATAWARDLIARLGGKALAVDPKRWGLYHAAAVMACNYQVTLVDAALELMEIAGIERGLALGALAPILRAATENILSAGPERALTGPIRRGDIGTLRAHLEAIEAALPETKRLYVTAGLRTIPIASRAGLSPQAVSEVAMCLEQAK